jgi:hypothetical protein
MTLGTVLINVVIPLNGTIRIEYRDERHFERLRMDFRINELDPKLVEVAKRPAQLSSEWCG